MFFNRHSTRVIISLVVLALSAWVEAMPGASAASQPATRPIPLPADDLVGLNFPEDLDLRLLIQFVSQRLKLNILYDEQLISQKVTLKASTKIPVRSLRSLLENVLRSKNLALVETGQKGWLRIVSANNLAGIAVPTTCPIALDDASAETAVTQFFVLQYADAQKAESLIRPFLTQPGGSTMAVPDQRLLIVTDYGNNLKRIFTLIAGLDKPREITSVFVPIQNMEVMALVQQATQILSARTRNLGYGTGNEAVELVPDVRLNQVVMVGHPEQVRMAWDVIKSLDVPLKRQTHLYRFQATSAERVDRIVLDLLGKTGTSKWRYESAVDKDTNVLIVSTSPEVHAQIEQIVRELDTVKEDISNPIRFYKLANATAADVLGTIRSIDGNASGAALPNGPTPQGTNLLPRSPAVPQASGGATSLKGDAGSFPSGRLTPSASPQMSSGLAGASVGSGTAFMPTMGEREPTASPLEAFHAKIQGRSATITADRNTNSIIVIGDPAAQHLYQQLIAMLDKRRPQVLIECTIVTLDTSNGFSLGVEIAGHGKVDSTQFINLSQFGLNVVGAASGSITLSPGLGLNSAILNPSVGDLVVHALATNSHSRIVSAPKILVNDNATGTLASVAEQPVVSLNTTSLSTSTTTFAGYASAGTSIAVTPHISESDHLQLEYAVSLNSFTGNFKSTEGIPPPRVTDEIQSKVTIPDGYTIVVGGLNRKSDSTATSSVPLLGEIPLLKYLFGSTTTDSNNMTLFVFIRPIILRDDQFSDLKFLSERDVKNAELSPDLPSSLPVPMH